MSFDDDKSYTEMIILHSSEDEEENRKRKSRSKGKEGDQFKINKMFELSRKFKETVQDYAIKNGKDTRRSKSSKKRMKATSAKKHSWRIYASLSLKNDAFVIKMY